MRNVTISKILTVWQWLNCLIVSSWMRFKTQIFQANLPRCIFFFSHSIAEQREVGTKVIISTSRRNILCALLAYKDLVVELKCWMLQAVRVNRVATQHRWQLRHANTHLPLVVIGDVNDGHQEGQDDQVEEEVRVLILRVVAVCSFVAGLLHVVWRLRLVPCCQL